MTATAPAELRARGWEVLSALYLEGVTERTIPLLAAVPGLTDHLPGGADAHRRGEADHLAASSTGSDEAAAEHHRLFGLEVRPWASVFLERDGVLGGAVTDSVARDFARFRVEPPEGSELPDHLGQELRLLATVTRRGDDRAVAEVLEGHLLWWLPVFVHSVARIASPLWKAVAELTLEAALDQAAAVRNAVSPGAPGGDGRAPVEVAPPGALALPPEDPLESADAGIALLARHLVTPARGGLHLAMADIRGLGRERDLPGGFGRRQQVLTTLIRSAAGYGELPGLVASLRRLVEDQRRFLASVPSPYRDPWVARLDALAPALARLTEAA